MKVYLLIGLLALPILALSQLDIKKVVAEKKPVPSNWVEIINSKASWTLIKEGSLSKEKVKSLKQANYKKIIKDTLFDRTNKRILYYPAYNTFYTGNHFDEYWDMGVSVVSQVLYVDSSWLIIKKVPFFLFDKDSGKILSVAEVNAIWNENRRLGRKAEFEFTNQFIEPKSVLLEIYKAD